jgi:hypothetical protein
MRLFGFAGSISQWLLLIIVLQFKLLFSSPFFARIVSSKHLPWWIILAAMPFLFLKAWGGGEFNTYLGAAEQLRLGNSCYNVWLHYGHQNGSSQYGYSPLFATLLIPFTYLPVWLPPLLLLVADVLMLASVFSIFFSLLDVEERKKPVLFALTMIFSLRLTLHNFEMVQLNILLLWMSVYGLYLIFIKGQNAAGASIIALGINFKLLPLLLIPYLMYRAKFNAVGIILLVLVGTFLLPSLVFGFEKNLSLHLEWWQVINPLNAKYNALQNEESYRLHGLAALFASYFSKNVNGTFQLLLAELSPKQLVILTNIGRALLAGIALLFLAGKPFKSYSDNKHFAIETAYILFVTPLLFPQQNKWAFVNMLPAFCIVFYVLISYKSARTAALYMLLAVVFFLTTLTTDGIIGKQLNYYTECLKMVTIGCLLMIPALLIVRKKLVFEKQTNVR